MKLFAKIKVSFDEEKALSDIEKIAKKLCDERGIKESAMEVKIDPEDNWTKFVNSKKNETEYILDLSRYITVQTEY